MAEIMTSVETAANRMYAAPHAPPTVWVNHIKTNLNEKVYHVMADNRVPWLIIKGMVDAGWTDLNSVSNRFPTQDSLHDKGPGNLDIAG